MPVSSSAIPAMCSPVARSAASAGRADLEHPPRLVHLVEGEAVEGGQELERRLAELRRPLHDEGAGAAARGDDAHRLQRAQPGAQRGAADAHLQGELALGGQAVAGAEAAGLDLPADVLDDLGAGRGVASPAAWSDLSVTSSAKTP